MAIKTLEELKAIREKSKSRVNLREKGENSENITEIMVGMATCGIAAGARDTFNTLLEEINKKDLQDVRIVQVGCLGYCHSEPIIQINKPNEEPIIYGNVDSDKAREIVEKHIIGGDILKDSVLINTFERA